MRRCKHRLARDVVDPGDPGCVVRELGMEQIVGERSAFPPGVDDGLVAAVGDLDREQSAARRVDLRDLDAE